MKEFALEKKALVYWACILLCLVSTLFEWMDTLRYAKYLVVPVCLLGWIIYGGSHQIYLPGIVYAFLFIVIASMAMAVVSKASDLATLVIVVTYILPFVLFGTPRLNIGMINLALILVYVVSNYEALFLDFSIDVINSYSSAENSIYGFVFGLFVLHHFYRKRWIFCALNLILLLVAGKRSAVGAALLLMALWWLVPARIIEILTKPLMMLAFNLLALIILGLFAWGSFDYTIKTLTGKSADHLTFGRQTLYSPFVEEIVADPMDFVVTGNGWASSRDILMEDMSLKNEIKNMHSDLLRMTYELGLVAFLFFIYLLYRHGSQTQKFYTLYVNAIFVTDNILIYVVVMFIYILLYESEGLKDH